MDTSVRVRQWNTKGRILRTAVLAVVATTAAVLPVGSASAGAVVVPRSSGAGVALTDGSMYNVVDQIGARALWKAGFTGKGVNVAVIDTGVAPVDALSGADKVVAMVDLSAEAGVPEAEFRDTYGHGTHMAGIIAGRDPGADPKKAAKYPEWFLGVAPDAGIVSVKVGDNTGAVDVTQVIAGVDWVVENAAALNIRVINLSYGSGSTLGYQTDPLAFAVERAWKAGIVVVSSVGNDGRADRAVDMPAADPYVIAVAGAEVKNKKFHVPAWSSTGKLRNPDVAAPGASIVSLRAPGSRADIEHPEGYVNEYLFKGSGSSQAAAVTSGAVALLLSARPTLTPDQVKALLTSTANGKIIVPVNPARSGNGLLQIDKAKAAPTPKLKQTWPASTGTGSLDAARGGNTVTYNGVPLTGNVTVNGAAWPGATWTGVRWSGGTWDGVRWSDASWLGVRWSGVRWSGARWSGARWSGVSWTGARWSDQSWTSSSWTGVSWTGARWSDQSWTGARWSGARWSGARWSAAGWF
jgi:serine protease AprX